MRIVMADDNPDMRATTRALLQLAGHEVQEAQDGADALVKARALKPDAMLLDIGMPGMDGYAVARYVRQEAWGRDIFLVSITGYGEAEDLQKSCEAGFNAHRVKPPDMNELLALLDDWQAKHPQAIPDSAC
jgi:CheY-like chemotaxis protein